MDSSYRETKKKKKKKRAWQHGSGNVLLQSCPSVYLLSARRHVLIAGINCKTPGTIVTQVIKLQVTQQCNLQSYSTFQTPGLWSTALKTSSSSSGVVLLGRPPVPDGCAKLPCSHRRRCIPSNVFWSGNLHGVSFPIQAMCLQNITICQIIHVMHAREFFVCIHYHFAADCNPRITDFIRTYQIWLLNWRRQDIVRAGLRGIQAHIIFIRNLITCVKIVPGVLQFIPAIRMCQHALSKYTLRQLCNHTFPDPCCHTLFFHLSIWGIHSWRFAIEFWYTLYSDCVSSSEYKCWMVGWFMNNYWKGSGKQRSESEVLSWHRPRGTEENYKQLLVCLLHAGFLHSLLLNLQDGGDIPVTCQLTSKQTTQHYISEDGILHLGQSVLCWYLNWSALKYKSKVLAWACSVGRNSNFHFLLVSAHLYLWLL
jgi:hypothetical protein